METMSPKSLRSIFGFGSEYNQVYSMESFSEFDVHLDNELKSFQHQVFNQFKTLSESHDDEFLSLNWLSKLLDAFIACHQEFKTILTKHKVDFTKPPLDESLKELLNKSIKSLDVCNAICYGIEKMKYWHKYLEIVSSALNSEYKILISQGQFRRSRKALIDLYNIMYDDSKDSRWFSSSKLKSLKSKDLNRDKWLSKSLSWSVHSSWSTSKQLQSMEKAHEITNTCGLANVVFTMNFVNLFVLWVLMAATPSQDKCLHTNISIPRHFLWSTPFSLIYVRIMDEFKKRDSKNNVGLLKENYQMEKSIHFVANLVDYAHDFSLTQEQRAKVELGVNEVELVNDAYEKWLHPLECQVRLVFREIMSIRLEGLEILTKS